ncbi:amino acid permease [Aeribacillus pallidus]|uniref:Amino acid permease n=1 Tax=Aeribacillus pallidus TaxID=33936 RepID=A0A165X2S1_9BACI|nr:MULTISPECIES: amino acid permease [Aeribacillus]KZN95563.1 amino acid permease [Aeribacillus pallidus]MDR9797646.1 amino acid permease [Aeribacillus pallidus]MED1441211.1 amino acid permease [Aeribacillus composti]TVZ81881.1 amino acid/polyamine/organocation transporter (APC superfamily) [Aeribacillus composti]BBU41154.1 amino acid permease [Aeribacillus pallidus]
MSNKFSKSMSRADVLFLSVGAMLGWGWVVLSGDWISKAGFLGTAIAFLLGGLLVTFIGLTYAELAAAIPETGGGLVFVQRAFNDRLGYIAAWSVLFGYVSVITFEAVALPTVIDYIIPVDHQLFLWNLGGWDIYLTWVLIGSFGSLLLTSMNYFGIKPAAIFQNILTIAVILIGLVLVFGAFANGGSVHTNSILGEGVGGVMVVLIMIPFLFVGFDVIPQIASEVKAPPKVIGRILIFSIILAIVFYILIAYGVSVGLTPSQLEVTRLATADAMTNLFRSPVFGTILVIGGVAGIVTSWNAFIIGGSRILFAMAERGMIPKWFAYIHPKYKTPTHGIIFLGLLGFFAPFLGHSALNWFVNAGGIGIVIGYMLVSISFMKLRKTEPDLERPYKIRNWKLTGVIAIILSIIFITFYLPGMPSALVWPMEWLIVFGWYGIGTILYLFGSRKDSVKKFKDVSST